MDEMDWTTLEGVLAQLQSDVSPAGLHGQLAAMACRLKPPPADYGLAGLPADAEASVQIKALFALVRSQLESADLGFAPLLPDDDQILWRRLEAIGEWAECFAFGLSLGGGFEPKQLSADGQECLNHLLEISRIDPDDDQAQGAEAEEAYTELVEFLRIAVLTLYVELRTLDAKPPNTAH
ncbi:MAG: UPF0149 family protein [Oceanococcaceae bacterium]